MVNLQQQQQQHGDYYSQFINNNMNAKALLHGLDHEMKNWNIEFFISIDDIKGIIHITKKTPVAAPARTSQYHALFTYIVFREFGAIQTKTTNTLETFITELDQLLDMKMTTAFHDPSTTKCLVQWRKYIHHKQGLGPDDRVCYICLEDSFDTKLACGHYLCRKCMQKSTIPTNNRISYIKCGICRSKTTRKVSNCVLPTCNHTMCRFQEDVHTDL